MNEVLASLWHAERAYIGSYDNTFEVGFLRNLRLEIIVYRATAAVYEYHS